MLKADIAKGEIPNNSVRYSIRIDSDDRITANKKTIHDFLINSNYYGKICRKINLAYYRIKYQIMAQQKNLF